MPELEHMSVTRIVASPAALDALDLQLRLHFRTAPDEIMLLSEHEDALAIKILDAHKIQINDTNWYGIWLESDAALNFLAQLCEWRLPDARPAFAQGAVANVPVKLWLETDRVLILTAGPFRHDLQERMNA